MLKHINKNNLHHAYLIEGNKEEVIPEIFSLLKELNIETKANPDFLQIDLDSFKIDDARTLKSLTSEMSFSNDIASKKVFIISANSFLLEAQNSLLKVFEEPIENTHFFIVAPSTQIFLPTLLSRFYVIKNNSGTNLDVKEAQLFIQMPLGQRIDYLKDLLKGTEDDEESETDSPRTKALRFLDGLEQVLHKSYISKTVFDKNTNTFEQIFKVRKYLRQPGSSAKSLMESVALSIPEKML
ncbi:MAG: hypothetical protein M3Q34_00920 [bacterium]|nr:hypothetical protein [bacterium]